MAVNGIPYFKCGINLNYQAITERVKQARGKFDKDRIMGDMRLGCKLYVKEDHYGQLDQRLSTLHSSGRYPKCHHQLLTKVDVSQSQQHKGRTYFTCPTHYPDIPCRYFEWGDSIFAPNEHTHDVTPATKGTKRRSETPPTTGDTWW
jgi:hypothetical protein